jgi:DNA-binding XRE family transcriptional regulator
VGRLGCQFWTVAWFSSRGLRMNQQNNVKQIREAKMLSKAELARMAGLSPLTIDRIEKGKPCRMATKRKILLALGLKVHQKQRVFDR